MKKLLLFSFSIPLVVVFPAYAETSANVEVHNKVNATSNSTSNNQATTHTDITVETNGNTTHYESEEAGDVSVKSVNGVSEIKVNGTVVSGAPTNETSKSPTLTPNPTISPEPTQEEIKNFAERILEQLKRPFRIFAHFFPFLD